MTCPKCEEGTLINILFKKTEQTAFLCDFCGAVWFAGDNINVRSAHTIESLTKNGDMEYTFVDKQNEDKKSVRYPREK